MVTIYTTNRCPKCKVLKAKLKIAEIEFDEVTDEQIMIDKGFTSVPVLEVGDILMDFAQANEWIIERIWKNGCK